MSGATLDILVDCDDTRRVEPLPARGPWTSTTVLSNMLMPVCLLDGSECQCYLVWPQSTIAYPLLDTSTADTLVLESLLLSPSGHAAFLRLICTCFSNLCPHSKCHQSSHKIWLAREADELPGVSD